MPDTVIVARPRRRGGKGRPFGYNHTDETKALLRQRWAERKRKIALGEAVLAALASTDEGPPGDGEGTRREAA